MHVIEIGTPIRVYAHSTIEYTDKRRNWREVAEHDTVITGIIRQESLDGEAKIQGVITEFGETLTLDQFDVIE